MVPKISPATVGVVSVEGAPAAAEGRELTVAVGGAVVTISDAHSVCLSQKNATFHHIHR